MKANVMICAALCFLVCWMLPVDSKKISFIINVPKANPSVPMSMVEDAIDDAYLDCNDKMLKTVKSKYFKKEKTGIFQDVWKNAKVCANKNLKNLDKGDEGLTKDHMRAICVYTSGYKKFYKTFNAAVQSSRAVYGTSFPYHTLHFWLTSALQILNNNKNCHTTYRRTNMEFTGIDNQIVRFGFFASTSYDTTLTSFGKKTCFKITTCSGAFLKHYPHLGDTEREVLIPPYEMFSVTKKKKNQIVEGLNDCEVVYILQSAGNKSNLNCRAA